MELEIKEFNGEGYMPLIAYNGWRVAIIGNDNTNSENSERFYFKNKTKKTLELRRIYV